MKNFYPYGNEFMINGHTCYPAYLDKKYLQEFASRFVTRILNDEAAYAQVRAIKNHFGKALSWEIIKQDKSDISPGKLCFDRAYTFGLKPSWEVSNYHDHWLSGSITPRCQQMGVSVDGLQKIVIDTLQEMKREYENTSYVPLEGQHLMHENWEVIINNDA